MLKLRMHTHQPRALAIAAITEALGECGTILQDMHEYSNRMTTYRFEIETTEVDGFVDRLQAAELRADSDSDDPKKLPAPDDDGFIVATLQVTFPAEDGNKRVPNPDLG